MWEMDLGEREREREERGPDEIPTVCGDEDAQGDGGGDEGEAQVRCRPPAASDGDAHLKVIETVVREAIAAAPIVSSSSSPLYT